MTVMTVLGPIDGSQLGRGDAHEHIFLRSPVLPGDEFQDLDTMATEVDAVHESGIDTIVDLTPIGLGRLASKTARRRDRRSRLAGPGADQDRCTGRDHQGRRELPLHPRQ